MARLSALEPLYRAYTAFRERCLVDDRSMLWPDQEVWTIANLEQVRRRFVVEILAPFVEETGDALAQREIARLHGEDLVVALSRMCEGEDRYHSSR
jgi:hypothetical protein